LVTGTDMDLFFHCGADNGTLWNVIQMRQSLPW